MISHLISLPFEIPRRNYNNQFQQGVSIGVQRTVALYTTLLEVKIEESLNIADFNQI